MNARVLTLPTAAGFATLLGGLMGRTAPNKRIKVDWSKEKGPLHISEFVFPDGAVAALLIADLAFCAYTGAALTMLQPGVAASAIRAGKLDEQLAGNYAEVANVLTAVFREFQERVVLGKSYDCREALPEASAPLLKSTRRLELEVTVTGYGAGRCAFLLS